MANPAGIIEWQNVTDIGISNIGTYNAAATLVFQFFTTSTNTSSIISYKLLSGVLPKGLSISTTGELSGTLAEVAEQTTYTFTVRAQDQFGNLRDKTFDITILVGHIPALTTATGTILNVEDSLYIAYQFAYTNPISSNIVHFTIANGELPPGLQLMESGMIVGYPIPPILNDGSPTTITYNFTIQLNSGLGIDAQQYSITIRNQNLTKPRNTRVPVLLNSKPLHYPIDDDLYHAYYVSANKVIPTIRANEFFTFKFIGNDFDNQPLYYFFKNLPPGLTGDVNTGWVTGSPIMNSMGINTYQISVAVAKLNDTTIRSHTEVYSLTITNDMVDDITWITPIDMGTIYNGTISELQIKATSSKHLVYSFNSGTIPPNLTLTETGHLVGRVAFQPSDTTKLLNDETEFHFTVLVYSDQFPVLKSTREFKIKVKQYFSQPLETVYFKASPNLLGRSVINSLLTNESLIPSDYLYRADDVNFGKATDVTVLHATGMTPVNLDIYLTAIEKNHYYRDVLIGELKTAVARDDNNNIIYEVVYCELIDNLVNNKGTSVPLRVKWPQPISANLGPWKINNTNIHSSFTDYYASLSVGTIYDVYPASISNMRTELVNNIQQTTDNILLPRWMTSQQLNGNTLGFLEAWVICYTLPGYSETIKTNITNNWPHSFNEIDFTIDRYYVDKSATFDWNTLLQKPTWNELPSASPTPDPTDKHDMIVLFPDRTILSGQT